MGVRILTDGDNAVLYCSTSDWAFGPLFGPGENDDRDPSERADAFCKWLATNHSRFEQSPLSSGSGDPRTLTEAGLASAYGEWLSDIGPNGGEPCRHSKTESLRRDIEQGETYGEEFGQCKDCSAFVRRDIDTGWESDWEIDADADQPDKFAPMEVPR